MPNGCPYPTWCHGCWSIPKSVQSHGFVSTLLQESTTTRCPRQAEAQHSLQMLKVMISRTQQDSAVLTTLVAPVLQLAAKYGTFWQWCLAEAAGVVQFEILFIFTCLLQEMRCPKPIHEWDSINWRTGAICFQFPSKVRQWDVQKRLHDAFDVLGESPMTSYCCQIGACCASDELRGSCCQADMA